jgi:hypothetical protein
MVDMTTNGEEPIDTSVKEAAGGLYRDGDNVIAIFRIDGKRVIGISDNMTDALKAAFSEAYPWMKELKVAMPALMSLPKLEDLPELPKGLKE